jgi:hypothetical protein
MNGLSTLLNHLHELQAILARMEAKETARPRIEDRVQECKDAIKAEKALTSNR